MAMDHHIEDDSDRVSVDVEVEGRKGRLDFTTLKTGGIIKQRQRGKFTVRLKCPGGRVPVERLATIADVAERYGGDYVHLSVRQSIEIPYVDYRDLAGVHDELSSVGQEIASCGPRVRVPTACSGCEYNPNGLMDTQRAAARTCRRFFGAGDLVHKFKIAFSACPIDCARTNEMDLGFQGAVRPAWDPQPCTGCRICADACKEGAIEADPQTGEPVYDAARCLYCGDCIRACPTEAWAAQATGWVVRCGGKHGRHPIHGQAIAEFLPDREADDLIAAVLAWYERNGRGKGRTRIGTLLMDEAVWREFLAHLRSVLGEWAVADPPAPRRNEIHTSSPGSQAR
ncbi:MAG: 4Fe-4S dicluster domain-containing protein [bacterium]